MHAIGRTITIAALLFASGCRIDTNQPPAATAEGSTGGVATTQAVSVVSVAVASNGLTGESSIADNFDGTPGLIAAPAQPLAGDGAAAFRFFCSAGQLAHDDPLFDPGQPGVSHLHQFFGNTGTNASSNYQSLRTSGGTTCGQSATPFNRSAYWFPAMLDGAGHAIKPHYISVYYKRNSASDPMCSLSSAQHLGQCVDLPNGIRYVFGYNMKDGSHANEINFACYPSDDGLVKVPSSATGWFKNIREVVAAGCPVGAELVIAPNAPNCWDGQNVDTPDHRAHMSYATGPWYTGQLFNACPADHPYVVPDMELLIHFTIDASAATWHVSSDEMVPGALPGSTFHVDYWEAWSPAVKAAWHNGCINLHLSCGGASLGDGTAIKGGDVPNGGWPLQQLVAAP